MIKIQFIDTIQILKGQSTKNLRYHTRLIEQIADRVRNGQIKEYTMQMGELPDDYLSTKELTIQEDARRGQHYVEFDVYPLSIPGTPSIKYITSLRGDGLDFIMSRSGSSVVYSNLEAGNIAGKVDCYQENKRIYFRNLPFDYYGKNILLKYIVSITNMKDEDNIAVPDEEKFLLEVSKIMDEQKTNEIDKLNDNRP